ncbi:MAG: hypothetical protein WCF33_05030, partial [Pseudonocardiaceae bacterium]
AGAGRRATGADPAPRRPVAGIGSITDKTVPATNQRAPTGGDETHSHPTERHRRGLLGLLRRKR